jgi:hypothetical protein
MAVALAPAVDLVVQLPVFCAHAVASGIHECVKLVLYTRGQTPAPLEELQRQAEQDKTSGTDPAASSSLTHAVAEWIKTVDAVRAHIHAAFQTEAQSWPSAVRAKLRSPGLLKHTCRWLTFTSMAGGVDASLS